MVSRKICVITGSRAEYGLLQFVLRRLQALATVELQLVATGMHLSPEFGLTWREIEVDGFRIDRKVEMLTSSDTEVGTTKATGLGLIGFADVFADLSPDIVVVLGDRFEILAAATAALFARIPVAHLHGGETTVGAFDEGMRHAITKLSHLHFVAAEDYRRRVIQLGEDPNRVFLCGGLGVDAIRQTRLMDREELEASLDFTLGERNLLVTWHPETLSDQQSDAELQSMLSALDQFTGTKFIITLPNADPGGRNAGKAIQDWSKRREGVARCFASLGQRRYWSLMNLVDGVVGNSSSGLLEAPSFRVGTLNIGNRQQGRLMAESVISVPADEEQIVAGITKLLSEEFQQRLHEVDSPYGLGGAAEQIVQVLETVSLDGELLRKSFYDQPHAEN